MDEAKRRRLWDGRRVLERPLDQMLQSGLPEFPFCICWANENWTRNWDGSKDELLIAQDYSGDTCERFIYDVIPILKDPRYIRVKGAPILLVYRVNEIPDPPQTAQRWRAICAEEGISEIHLCAVQSFGISDPARSKDFLHPESLPEQAKFFADEQNYASLRRLENRSSHRFKKTANAAGSQLRGHTLN